ncbi:MTH1187 family thiamine-binding protein [Candidatus Latescibacterota bacterium]
MEIAVYPLGTDNSSITKEVSKIFEVLDTCKLTYQITTMGTIIEGTPDKLFEIARNIHETVFSDSVKRVITIIKIDDKR